MRVPIKAMAVASVLAMVGAIDAAAEARIGLAAPLGETMALLGEQVLDGASSAARALGVELLAQDDQCSAEGGRAAASAFVDNAVEIVVGFLCTEAIEAALPALTQAGIPVVTPGVRADRLTDGRQRTGHLVWRMAPRADGEAGAAVRILSERWRDDLFAIVDDGTVYGRGLSESFRLGVESAGLRPVFVDTYRPQSDNQIGLAGRLRQAGATHVFAGGEALRAASDRPLAAGTLMIASPEWADLADEGVVERFAAEDIVPEGYVVPAYAAIELAVQALHQADAEDRPLGDVLAAGSFTTMAGPVAFDARGDLAESPWRLFRYDGERFMPVE